MKSGTRIAAAVAVLSIALFAGCDDSTQNNMPNTHRGRSWANGGHIETCIHDGHWFVVFGGNGGGVCHHPDCPKCKPNAPHERLAKGE